MIKTQESKGIKSWPKDDRPREKLLKNGEQSLSNSDGQDWKEFKGLCPAKIAQIKAALEIGRRFREDETRLERP